MPQQPIIINGPRIPIIIEGSPAPPTAPPQILVASSSGSALGSGVGSQSGSAGGWTIDLGNGNWAIAWGTGTNAVTQAWGLAWGAGTSLRNLAWLKLKQHIDALRNGNAYLEDGVTPRLSPLTSAALGDASIAIGIDGYVPGADAYPGWSGPVPNP
jgi:hypothetical protein